MYVELQPHQQILLSDVLIPKHRDTMILSKLKLRTSCLSLEASSFLMGFTFHPPFNVSQLMQAIGSHVAEFDFTSGMEVKLAETAKLRTVLASHEVLHK